MNINFRARNRSYNSSMKKGSDFERLKAQCGTWAREDYYVNPDQGHDFRSKLKAEKKQSIFGYAVFTSLLAAGVFFGVFKGDYILKEVTAAIDGSRPVVAVVVEH